MSAQDVLVDSVEIGAIASESDVERKDLLGLLRVFKDALLVELLSGELRTDQLPAVPGSESGS